jgi:hypothetical protein
VGVSIGIDVRGERINLTGGIMKGKGLIIPYAQKVTRKGSWIRNHQIRLVPADPVAHAGIQAMSYLATP